MFSDTSRSGLSEIDFLEECLGENQRQVMWTQEPDGATPKSKQMNLSGFDSTCRKVRLLIQTEKFVFFPHKAAQPEILFWGMDGSKRGTC